MCSADAPHPTVDESEVVVTRAGRRVRLRPITGEDRARLATGYRQLSDRTAYRRFFTVFPELSAAQLRFLTEIDHHGHEAIGAEDVERGGGVGVARYVGSPAQPTSAEVAVTVVDDWQGLGVGSALLDALAQRARVERITEFTAEVLTENTAIPALLAHVGSVALERGDDPSTRVVRVDLTATAHPGG